MREQGVAYLLWLGCCVGLCGLHRFYLDSFVLGIVWLCTYGLFSIGQLIDLLLIPGMVQDCNAKYGGGQQHVVITTTAQPVVQQQPVYVQQPVIVQQPVVGYVPPQPYVQQTIQTTTVQQQY